jgi:hypothetical protein
MIAKARASARAIRPSTLIIGTLQLKPSPGEAYAPLSHERQSSFREENTFPNWGVKAIMMPS